MAKFRLGKTELMVEKQGFGCLPIQRCTRQEAAAAHDPLQISPPPLTFPRSPHIITASQKRYGRGVPVPRGTETERPVQALRWGRRRWLPCSGAEHSSQFRRALPLQSIECPFGEIQVVPRNFSP